MMYGVEVGGVGGGGREGSGWSLVGSLSDRLDDIHE